MDTTTIPPSGRPLPEGTPRLIDAVSHAFSDIGPVYKIMGQYRPLQREAAMAMAHFVQEQHDSPPFQRLFAQEQRAGIGKTIAVAVVLGFDAVLNGNRSVVSTNTRALRAGYFDTMADVNAIIKMTLAEIDCDLYRPIVMAERTSVSQNISPSKVAAFKRRLGAGLVPDTILAREFIEFFDSTAAHEDDPPTIDMFLYERHGALPEGTTADDWSMCSADRAYPIWKLLRDRNEEALMADIIGVTHSMMIRNSISNGRALNTRVEAREPRVVVADGMTVPSMDDKTDPPTGMCVIDEADKLPQIAYDSQSPATSLLTLASLLEDIATVYQDAGDSTKAAIERGIVKAKNGLEFFEAWSVSHDTMDPSVTVGKDDFIATEIVENLIAIDAGLIDLQAVSYGQYDSKDRDILLSDKIERIQENLHAIRNFRFYHVPKMSLRTYINHIGERDLEIRVNLGFGLWLINQYWRPRDGFPLHSFGGVIAVSATLTDLPPHSHRYSWFRKHFGYVLREDGKRLVERLPIPLNRREPYGSVRSVIVPDRIGTPRPIINDGDTYTINPDFVKFGAIAINQFAKVQAENPETRMLALFPSYALIDKFYDELPHLHERIIARQKGSNLHRDIKRFADTPAGIFFAVEWEGVNFVERDETDGTQHTLVDFLVFTKIPQPPSDHIRQARIAEGMMNAFNLPDEAAKRKAFGLSLRDNSAHAYRKMVQGLGRGVRNETDIISAVLILDDRFPVPRHVAKFGDIQRCRPNSLFGSFDSIFDPYAVEYWSKMNLEGKITQVYPV